MGYCTNCGKEIDESSKFCTACGTPVAAEAEVAEAVDVQIEAPGADEIAENDAPVVDAVAVPVTDEVCETCYEAEEGYTQEELEYLENTKTFLEWERKIWIIFGILWSVASFFYMFIYFIGIFYVPMIVISFVAAKKTKRYIDIVDTDLLETKKRMESIGMLVFSVFFTAPVFFILNFIRVKTNAAVVESIISKQGGNTVI